MNLLGHILDGQRAAVKTKLPDAVIEELLASINARFYAKTGARQWLQDQKPLMLALTWPATWLAQRGISLTLDRYEAILREILTTVQTHGEVAAIKYFPAYLLRCVRLWFVHHGEALYEERKRIRNAIDLRMLKGGTPRTAPDPIEALVAANRVLAAGGRRIKTAKNDTEQTSFFEF